MESVEKLTKQIRTLFHNYGFNDYGFFVDTIDGPDVEPVDLFRNGVIDDETLYRLYLATGFTKEELLHLEIDGGTKFLKKYPFFAYLHEYKQRLFWAEDHIVSREEAMLNNIFGLWDNKSKRGLRHTDTDLKKRLLATLKEFDKYAPGTIHKNAKISFFRWNTNVLFSFPQCQQMLRLFFETVDAYEQLFFRALDHKLTVEEAADFNFLSGGLHVADQFAPTIEINSSSIGKMAAIYKSEKHKDICSYIRFRVFNDIEPWMCKEFYNDRELAQKYLKYVRGGKKTLAEYARNVGSIYCVYSWSDDDDRIDREQNYIPQDERDYIRESIYIDKTPEELADFGDSMNQLMQAIAAETKGGLKNPTREFDPDSVPIADRFEKQMYRSAAYHGYKEPLPGMVDALAMMRKAQRPSNSSSSKGGNEDEL